MLAIKLGTRIFRFVIINLCFLSTGLTQAAKFSLQKLSDTTAQATWSLSDEEYIFADNIEFKTSNGEILNAECPKGESFEHSFFGAIRIIKGDAICILGTVKPLLDGTVINSTVHSCELPEKCQAPVTQTAVFGDLVKSNKKPKDNSLLGNLLSGNSLVNDDILTVDEAFKFNPLLVGDEGIVVDVEVADGHYLYRDKFSFKIANTDVNLGRPQMPVAKIKEDLNFGKMRVYYGNARIVIPFKNHQASLVKTKITVFYQGCAEKGICYPPSKKQFDIGIPASINTMLADGVQTDVDIGAITDTKFNLNQQDANINNALRSGSVWLIVVAFFVAGLLLAFTPCVFPMVPILSGIITGQDKITTKNAFWLSLVYVLSMATVYALIGMLSGMIGESIQAWFQKTWVLLLFGALISVMALSMFGFFEIQMPSLIQNKANEVSNKQKSGSFLGVMLMGMLSALIVGSCSTPVLAVAIGYIGQTADPILGGIALFAMSIGMGLPLLIIGTSVGKFLPKMGEWMNTVKQIFGVLMLAVALYIIDPVFSSTVMLGLWAALLIATGVFMGTLNEQSQNKMQILSKALSVVLLIYGTIMMIGMATGKGTLLSPLKGLSGVVTSEHQTLKFERIKSLSDFEQQIEMTKTNNQFVMMDFYADWCKSCLELEEFTFADKRVIDSLQGVKLLQADVTQNNEADIALLQHFGINGPPAILFFNKNGQEIRSYRLNGFFGPEDFVKHVQSVF